MASAENKTNNPAEQPAEGQPKKAPPKFTPAQMRPKCMELFGVTASTFDGAAFGLKGTFTVEEMRAKITGWLAQKPAPVKKGGQVV
ncbi:MAG: hypothetical protein LBR72_02600 [Oscillospiraceae bacterium]|jgi:hypothetical protein|nr:hypothetical protein [Oscillospiraceae bacterium]